MREKIRHTKITQFENQKVSVSYGFDDVNDSPSGSEYVRLMFITGILRRDRFGFWVVDDNDGYARFEGEDVHSIRWVDYEVNKDADYEVEIRLVADPPTRNIQLIDG